MNKDQDIRPSWRADTTRAAARHRGDATSKLLIALHYHRMGIAGPRVSEPAGEAGRAACYAGLTGASWPLHSSTAAALHVDGIRSAFIAGWVAASSELRDAVLVDDQVSWLHREGWISDYVDGVARGILTPGGRDTTAQIRRDVVELVACAVAVGIRYAS